MDPFSSAGDSQPGPVFCAGYDSECSVCGLGIFEGDDIRADGDGDYAHADCIG